MKVYNTQEELEENIKEIWQWKTKDGRFITPSQMSTNHLFNTFLMLWNNICPPNMRIGKVKIYKFGSEYTPQYFKNAINFMGEELQQREDLKQFQKDQLNLIAKHFKNRIK